MVEQKVRIERVLVKDIVDFAKRHAEADARGQVVPISKLRAAAHAANPYADSNDVCLLVAMRGEDCVGYLGLMPGMLKVEDKLHKLYWYTTWYSGDDGQQAGAGGVLLLASLSLGYDIVGADLDEVTVPYYQRLRFQPLGPLPYLELSLDRLDPLGAPWLALRVLLRRRGRKMRVVDTAFAMCRNVSRTIFYSLFSSTIANESSGLKFRELSELPADAAFNAGTGVRFYRGPEAVRWRLTHPWITDEPDEATQGFFFSDYRDFVRFVVVELESSSGEKPLGHLVLSISRHNERTTVKVLDRFLNGEDDPRILVAAGLKYAKLYRADRLLLPEQCGPHLDTTPMMRRAFRRKSRLYYCHPRRRDSILPADLDQIQLDFCDGDTPFT